MALTSVLVLRHAATKGILVAMVCTFFEAFNVPVFWPILVMYFIMLFCITMKRQIKVKMSAPCCAEMNYCPVTAVTRGKTCPGLCLEQGWHCLVCDEDPGSVSNQGQSVIVGASGLSG
jgi:hypothetical protein